MSLRSQLGHIRGTMLCTFHRRTVSLGARGPIVSFTFDDFPRTAYSIGGSILGDFGARGTYYVAAGLANTSGELGDLFVEDDLHSLVEKGHEVASHTFRHSSCRSISFAEFRKDVQEGRRGIEQITSHGSSNFAYPFGAVTLQSKKLLGPELTSSRSIFPGFNGPEIDLNLLRANRLYGDLNASQQVEDLIRQNVAQKTWLIFYTHDVRPDSSQYGCTPGLLEFAVSQAACSGSRILTVQDALAEIAPAMAQAANSEALAVAQGTRA